METYNPDYLDASVPQGRIPNNTKLIPISYLMDSNNEDKLENKLLKQS